MTKKLWFAASSMFLCLVYILPLNALAANAPFTKVVVEAGATPWGKAVGDIDGDSQPDALAGFAGGGVYWYHWPDLTRYTVSTQNGGDDLHAIDVNNDGAPDALSNNSSIVWFQNPRGSGGDPKTAPWPRHVIDNLTSHDILGIDINNDGKTDVAIRQEFGPTFLYFQGATADTWTKVSMPNADDGNALTFADMDNDGRLDLVENGYWLTQPTNPTSGSWVRHNFTSWINGCSVMIADMNHDGRLDVVLSPSESTGRISWFEKPIDPINGTWIEHIVLDPASYVHRIRIADFNKDGNMDVAFAEMDQSSSDRVGVNYSNNPAGTSWTLQTLSTAAGHNIAMGDFGHDGDPDILNANWENNTGLEIWRDDINNAWDLNSWTYVNVDSNKSDANFGLTFGDLDGDGLKDIVTGQEWYKNPGGSLTGAWTKSIISSSVDSMLITDVDGDGRNDVIGQQASGGNVNVLWFKPANAAATSWTSTVVGTVPNSRDGQTQGYTLANLNYTGKPQIVFSSDSGDFYFTIPNSNPQAGNWPKVQINSTAAQEGISTGDINGDGKNDVVGFSHTSPTAFGMEVDWWQNPGNGAPNWTQRVVGTTSYEADRVRVADINGDGRQDIVVTDSDYNNSAGNLYWFEQLVGGTWSKHSIAANLGALASMDTGDFDSDGRPDIVIGEHRGDGLRTLVYQNIGGGASFTPHTIDTGKESHMGTESADLDNDTDLDVVSIAYDTYQKVHLWRNNAIVLGGPDTTPPVVSNVSVSNITINSATITWTTDEPADSQVDYGSSSSYGLNTVLDSSLVTSHSVNLAGLSPGSLYHYRADSKDSSGNFGTSADLVFTTQGQDVVAPVISNVSASSITATSATITWTTNEASDSQVDYGLSSSYGQSSNLNSTLVISHSVNLIGLSQLTTYHYRVDSRDATGNLGSASDFTFTTPTPDLTPPTVSMTAPSAGPVSGTVTVSANANDNIGVVGVQFKLDGVNLGAEDTTNPYSVSWDTTAVLNSSYNLTAVARDATGNTITSTAVNVTVNNIATPVTFAQAASVTNDAGGGNISQAFSSNNTAGDLIVASISWGDSSTVTCSDSQGNVYTTATSAYDVNNNQSLAICYAMNIKAGANTVTANFSNSNSSYRRLLIHEYRGIATSAALDVTAMNMANGTTAANNITSTAATTHNNGELIFGAVMNDAGTTSITAGTGFTQRASVNNKDLASEDQIQTTAGSIVTTQTFGAAHRYLAQMVTFKASGNQPPADTTFPTVSMTAPSAGPVSGTVTVSANANDNIGVVGVQFKLDGVNLGAEDTTNPYSVSWDTTTTFTGNHSLTAVARDAANNTTTATSVAVSVADTTAPIISNVAASNITPNSATITWTTNENSDSQVDYGLNTAYTSSTALNSSLVTSHSMNLTGLSSGTVYHYRVDSRDVAGNLGTSSSDVTFTTVASDTTPPLISNVVSSNFTQTSATISWTTDEISDSQIEYGLTTDYGASTVLNTSFVTSHSQNLSGLNPGTVYNYRVKSKDVSGNLAISGNFTFSTDAPPPPDTTAPSTPTNLSATAISFTQINLSWTASTDNVGVTGYKIYKGGVQVGTSVTTSYPDAGLSSGTTYTYTISAYDAAGNQSIVSSPASATTPIPDTTLPTVSITAPTSGATVSGTITISANASDNVAVSGVQFKLDGVNFGSQDTVAPYSISWSTNPVTNGSHTLTAVATDSSGNTATSAGIPVTVSNVSTVNFVQSTTNTNNGNATNITAPFTSSNTLGNLIVVTVSWGNNSTMSCSDSQGNVYAVATTQYDVNNNQSLAICYAMNSKAGINTVTATFGSSAAYRRLLIHEYSGIATTNALDVTAKNLANGTTAANNVTSLAAITTANGDLIFGAVMDDAGTTSITAGTGFTQRASVNAKDLASQSMVQATAGSVASTQTLGAAQRYLAQMVAFKHQ